MTPTNEMLGAHILAWATLIGTGLSLLGVGIAISQIRRTAKAAEAAELAAREARAAFSSNVLLTDLAGCVRSIEEIKAHLRAARFESALLRLTDTRTLLIQMRSMVNSAELRGTIQHVITQLAILRDLLEGTQNPMGVNIDRLEAMRSLGRCFRSANRLAGTSEISS
jgi:hypothetical protein